MKPGWKSEVSSPSDKTSTRSKKKLALLGLAQVKHIRNAVQYLRKKYPRSLLTLIVFDEKKCADLKSDEKINRVVFLGKSPSFLLFAAPGAIKTLRSERFNMLWVVAQYYPRNVLVQLLIGFLRVEEKRFRSTDEKTYRFQEAKRLFHKPLDHWFSKRNLRRWAIRLAYVLGEIFFPALNLKNRKRPFRKAEIKNILVLQMDLIGDVIWATPCLAALNKNYPHARLDVMVSPWCRDLLAYNPYVDNVITYDARWFRGITPSQKKSNTIDRISDIFFRLKIFFRRYDVVFELKGETSNVLFAYLTGAPYRIGNCFRYQPGTNLPPEHVRFLLTTDARYPLGHHTRTHQVEHNINVLRAAGMKIPDKDKELVLNLSSKEEESVNRLLNHLGINENDLLIGIHPGASRKLKIWRKEGFAAVADTLSKKYDAKIIITGSRSEIGLAEEIAALMKSPAFIAAGYTSLLEFACLVSKMHLIITNETSANSISSAVKTPVIVLMTGIPELYGPYRVPHLAIVNKLACRNISIEHCGTCPYDEWKCLQEIKDDEVIAASEGLLAKTLADKEITGC